MKNLGGIGYLEPISPLIDATIDVAISAAVNDPRFPSLTKEGFEGIEVEGTVLTKPKILETDYPSDYPNKINIAEDGFIIENGFNKGLLLPQVDIEYNMDVKAFLDNTCMKAGLNSFCLLDTETEVYTFQGQVFK